MGPGIVLPVSEGVSEDEVGFWDDWVDNWLEDKDVDEAVVDGAEPEFDDVSDVGIEVIEDGLPDTGL